MGDDALATTVLVPTLWRAHNVDPFLESLYATAGDIPVHPVFLCQDDDEDTLIAVARSGSDMMTFGATLAGPATMVTKINAAAAQVATPFMFGASDDIRLLPGCLQRCFDALVDPAVHVACVSDGIPAHRHGDELTGHCLIRTSYIRDQSGVLDEPNVVLHPGYQHFYSDLELWQVGRARGCYVSVYDARVDHPHPNNRTAPVDRVHNLSRRWRSVDRLLFQRRAWMWQTAVSA